MNQKWVSVFDVSWTYWHWSTTTTMDVTCIEIAINGWLHLCNVLCNDICNVICNLQYNLICNLIWRAYTWTWTWTWYYRWTPTGNTSIDRSFSFYSTPTLTPRPRPHTSTGCGGKGSSSRQESCDKSRLHHLVDVTELQNWYRWKGKHTKKLPGKRICKCS